MLRGTPVKPPPQTSWTKTLRLPKSSFPFRPTEREQAKYLKRCTDDLYHWQSQESERRKKAPFILHDGPPYANGALHLGHAMNKILKDVICRVLLMQGSRVEFVPGFDCHGLPIEMKALKEEREQRSRKDAKGQILDAVAIRRAARALATRTVEEQKKAFREWAIMADWDNAWKTMDPEYVKNQLSVFLEMVKNGLIFRRYKPVHWSPSSKTALAESELEYKVRDSKAAYIKFPLTSLPTGFDHLKMKDGTPVLGNAFAVIWTTTPWTLPANRAIAIHRDIEYCLVEVRDQCLLVAKSQVQNIAFQYFPEEPITYLIDSIKGADLEGLHYFNSPRGEEDFAPQSLIHADFVSEESGTGLVHCAPGHGKEDYEVCREHGIAAFAPVDDNGCFTSAALPDDPSPLEGLSVLKEGNEEVLKLLGDRVLGVHIYSHKYPFDWRTNEPVIMRATEQWFADLDIIKTRALKNLEAVEFHPEAGRTRLASFVGGRSEWCISRQRAWGVPIPALYDQYGKAVLTESSVKHIMAVIDERGTDAWWADADDDPRWICPDLPGGQYRRGKDTMDVWFDSGSSWMLTKSQADVYCEGSDQHRGWFQSSLLTHTGAAFNKEVAPYKTVITHGMILDRRGRKMSKSIGNGIFPSQIMDGSLLPAILQKKDSKPTKYDALGADTLRLWAASNKYTLDVQVEQSTFRSIHSGLLKYRNIIKMLLGSMRQDVSSERTALDMIALLQLQQVMEKVFAAYRNHEFGKGIKAIDKWINLDVSAFYMSAIKDRLYTGDGGSVFPEIYDGLLAMLAPVTPLLVEESWAHTPDWFSETRIHPLKQTYESTLSIINKILTAEKSAALVEKIRTDLPYIRTADAAIKEAQEEARKQKLIGSSLQCSVILHMPRDAEEANHLFSGYRDELDAIFVVSEVDIFSESEDPLPSTRQFAFSAEFCADVEGRKGVAWVVPAKHGKCERCWRYVVKDEHALCERCNGVVYGNK